MKKLLILALVFAALSCEKEVIEPVGTIDPFAIPVDCNCGIVVEIDDTTYYPGYDVITTEKFCSDNRYVVTYGNNIELGDTLCLTFW